jgi:hypothetical protein
MIHCAGDGMTHVFKEYSIASYERIYNTFAEKVVELFNAEEHLQAQIFLIALDTEEDNAIGEYVQLDPAIVAKMQTPEGQAAMWELMTECVTEGSDAYNIVVAHYAIKPDVIVHVTACWMAPETEIGLPPSQSIDRIEALLVSVHTPLAVFLGACPIDARDGLAAFSAMDTQPCSLIWSSLEDGTPMPPSIH